VLFIDKPAPDAPLGIWGVSVDKSQLSPELITERIAFYTSDLEYAVEYGQNTTTIERLTAPEIVRWTVPAAGRSVSISPGRTRIAWQVSNDSLPFERRTTQIWVASFDGSDPRPITTLSRGGFSGWLSDDVLLLSGRESLESRVTRVFALSLTDDSTLDLIRAERPRGLRLSHDRQWIAYFSSLSDEPSENGLWLVRTDGTNRIHLDDDLFGSYQWRDAQRLIIIPFRPEAVYHEFLEFDLDTRETRRLTDSRITPFKVANGDWQVSPDGRHVAFVENADRNIWLLTLND
jgi:Tol biopolymer transport system component